MSLRRILPVRVKRAFVEKVVLPQVEAEQARRDAKRRQKVLAQVPHWERRERSGPKEPVRVAVAGAGYGRYHVEALSSLDGVRVVSLLTAGGPRGGKLADDFGIDRLGSDLDDFAGAEDVDCFVVAVAPGAIREVAERCLATGRPVLVEKPPGLTSADTRALIRAAEEAGTWGMVGVNRRFYSLVEHGLAALAERGAIRGAILEVPHDITAERRSGRLSAADYDNWYVRNSIHGVDLLRYVLGDPVRVHSRTWPNAEFENRAASFAALLEYDRGVVATVLDLWDTPKQTRLKVVADGGFLELEPPAAGWIGDAKGSRLPVPVDPVDERHRPGLWAQDLHFVEAVRAGAPPTLPASTLEDALGTMLLIEQILADSLGQV